MMEMRPWIKSDDTVETLQVKLAAANAMVAKLEKDNARQKRLATISRLCKNVQSFRAEKAEEKIKQMQDAIEFDFERFMEFQRRAEQAEAQCAEIATAYQNMKGDFEHWAYCELIDSPPGKKCTCGVWEMVSAIENVDAGTAILADNKRMREALEEIANIGAAVQARQIAKAALEGNQRK